MDAALRLEPAWSRLATRLKLVGLPKRCPLTCTDSESGLHPGDSLDQKQAIGSLALGVVLQQPKVEPHEMAVPLDCNCI